MYLAAHKGRMLALRYPGLQSAAVELASLNLRRFMAAICLARGYITRLEFNEADVELRSRMEEIVRAYSVKFFLIAGSVALGVVAMAWACVA